MTDEVPEVIRRLGAGMQHIYDTGLAALNNSKEQARQDTWPAALAERLERAARRLQRATGETGLLRDPRTEMETILEDVDAARARGEIPARREVK